jgi:hypothetical protein
MLLASFTARNHIHASTRVQARDRRAPAQGHRPF